MGDGKFGLGCWTERYFQEGLEHGEVWECGNGVYSRGCLEVVLCVMYVLGLVCMTSGSRGALLVMLSGVGMSHFNSRWTGVVSYVPDDVDDVMICPG